MNPLSDAGGLVKQLAEQYGNDLVRYIARRARSTSDARDIAQESYVRLLRLDRKDLIRDPRSYLYRIATNVLYEFELRRQSDAAGLVHWADQSGAEDPTALADAPVERLIMRAKLEAVLGDLPPKCRAVLILHRRDGMTYDEIGKLLGISSSMVKKYLIKGLQICRSKLEDLH